MKLCALVSTSSPSRAKVRTSSSMSSFEPLPTRISATGTSKRAESAFFK